jgi:hypothetical protein
VSYNAGVVKQLQRYEYPTVRFEITNIYFCFKKTALAYYAMAL